MLREPHRGKGHAVRQGMLAATGDYVMFCDADFSMPVEEVVRFPEAMRRAATRSPSAPGRCPAPAASASPATAT